MKDHRDGESEGRVEVALRTVRGLSFFQPFLLTVKLYSTVLCVEVTGKSHAL